MLVKVKAALRVKHSALDTEITDLIEACKLDLSISGVKVVNESDPLISRAIIVYCKANFGIANEDAERYIKAYDLLKIHLSLCSDYNTLLNVGDFNV